MAVTNSSGRGGDIKALEERETTVPFRNHQGMRRVTKFNVSHSPCGTLTAAGTVGSAMGEGHQRGALVLASGTS